MGDEEKRRRCGTGEGGGGVGGLRRSSLRTGQGIIMEQNNVFKDQVDALFTLISEENSVG